MLNRIAVFSALLCIATLTQAVVLRDDRLVEVTIAKPPQRIVSLLPSLTETVCALGQCQKLVGVDRVVGQTLRRSHLRLKLRHLRPLMQ